MKLFTEERVKKYDDQMECPKCKSYDIYAVLTNAWECFCRNCGARIYRRESKIRAVDVISKELSKKFKRMKKQMNQPNNQKTKERTVRILIADDEGDMREGLWDVLESQGYQVTVAATGQEALERAEKIKFDLVIIDLKMPGMNGIETLKNFREISPTTEIIIMTGYPSLETATEALRRGVRDYIIKPFTMDEMTSSIERALQKRKLATENKELLAEQEKLARRVFQLEEQLKRSETLAAIGRLGAEVVHDIKNLLGIINVSTAYLKDKVDERDSKAQKHLKSIEKNIARSDALISSVVGLSRGAEPQIAPTDAGKELEDVLSLIEHQLSLQDIKIVRNYCPHLPQALVDTNELRRVFLNIIFNAQEAMAKGGELRISTNLEDDFVVKITFTDSGCGIPEEHLPDIFKPFFSTKAEGAGLGLSLCTEIIKKYHGSIQVESKSGEGATFTIKLPTVERSENRWAKKEVKEMVVS